MPSGAAKQALKAPIKLDAKSLPARKKIPPLQQRDPVDRAYDDFRQKYDATLAAIKRYERNDAECRTRTFSIADQRAAGCSESDTLRACNIKLFNHCANYHQDSPGGVIWTQMQMSAVTLRQTVLNSATARAAAALRNDRVLHAAGRRLVALTAPDEMEILRLLETL